MIAAAGFNVSGLAVGAAIDDLLLVLPHSDVVALETVLDVTPARVDGSAGTITVAELPCPVYAPDAEVNAAGEIPAARRACVVLRTEAGAFALAVDRVTTMPAARLTPVAVPRCMDPEHVPVTGLAVVDGKVACVTDAATLAARLRVVPIDGGGGNDLIAACASDTE